MVFQLQSGTPID